MTNTKTFPGSARELLIIALPMMASNACDTVMTFTDRMFLSKLGTAQMNAALGGGMTCFMMVTFFVGLIGYGTALVAQYYGAGQKRNCTVVVTQTLILSVLAYPIILMLSPLARAMFRASGIAPEQLAPQTLFFNILIYATIISLMRSALACFFSGIGRTRIVMISSLTAMAVNVIANYILVLGRFGCPSMGIRGAAYGTILGGACSLLIMIVAYFGGRTSRDFGLGSSFRFDLDIMKRLLRYGCPGGVEFFLNLAAFNVMIMLFHSCGERVATAATITFNWDMVAFVPLIGIEIAVSSLVGRYMGARKPDYAHRVTVSGLKIGSVYSGAMFVMFVLFPVALVNVFRPDAHGAVFAEALPLSLFMTRLIAVYVFFEAVMVAFCGALRGAGDTFWAMYTSVSLHWLIVAILAVMLKVLHTSPEAAWVTMIAWFMLFSLVFWLRYRSGKWRHIRVIHNPTEDQVPLREGFHETADI